MADLYLKSLESERKALWAECRLKGLPRDTPKRQRILAIDEAIAAHKAKQGPAKDKPAKQKPAKPKSAKPKSASKKLVKSQAGEPKSGATSSATSQAGKTAKPPADPA